MSIDWFIRSMTKQGYVRSSCPVLLGNIPMGNDTFDLDMMHPHLGPQILRRLAQPQHGERYAHCYHRCS